MLNNSSVDVSMAQLTGLGVGLIRFNGSTHVANITMYLFNQLYTCTLSIMFCPITMKNA